MKTQNFGYRGLPPLLTLHVCCCLNNSFYWLALSCFYVHKSILRIFYFHIISLIFNVFKLCCPAHLFPNTPRTCHSQLSGQFSGSQATFRTIFRVLGSMLQQLFEESFRRILKICKPFHRCMQKLCLILVKKAKIFLRENKY